MTVDRSRVTVVPDPPALAKAVAEHVVATLRRAIAARGGAHLALSGGSTPRGVNALLAAPPLREAISWERVVFWFGDERCVPPDDPQSNFRMNRETLLDPLRIDPSRVHRMRGEDDPGAAAADYEALLVDKIGTPPRFDLILLGMGPDGHTASLFPGTVAAIDRTDLCIAHYVPKLDRWRITFTPATLANARAIAVAAAGAEKADALHAVLDGPFAPDLYPAQLARPDDGELRWFVDAAAASRLTPL